MKTYSAKKEIKLMGIAMLIMGALLLFDDIPFKEFLFSRISYLIAIVLIIYGLMHVSKLDRFK